MQGWRLPIPMQAFQLTVVCGVGAGPQKHNVCVIIQVMPRPNSQAASIVKGRGLQMVLFIFLPAPGICSTKHRKDLKKGFIFVIANYGHRNKETNSTLLATFYRKEPHNWHYIILERQLLLESISPHKIPVGAPKCLHVICLEYSLRIPHYPRIKL